MKRKTIFAAVAVGVLAIVVAIAIQLIGRTSRGTVESGDKVPVIGSALRELRFTSPVTYDIFIQWGRHLGFLSSRAELASITNFANSHGFVACPTDEAEGTLKHLSKSRSVNENLIQVQFATNAAALEGNAGQHPWKRAYLRFRTVDGTFTMVFFN